ncbi:TSUP family transporter [Dasania sp. GY-MA-18]|uniref:Probable membrane transporter protein n=1 Tax=Dasania phycosphaerae TaxID=2950436 RepID=A0A9J6RMJ1_9GAMM|nr:MULTISPECIES: TSUP family transporter [Dasania]MCR8923105.1 TSUP family transporter [Dasania sp. GY-MA-18]MCZ0865537.1 TSUP family transporter [Dasania phycosphaerae]MCZ0869262.1 TSUP family transporter [Dasania phycosphaerae]
MAELSDLQYGLIALSFVWSGFVRSGLGFGGAVLSLPFMLLIHNDPLVYLPLISVHLLFFSALSIWLDQRQLKHSAKAAPSNTTHTSTIDWAYLKKSMAIMIVPKLVGVFGLITLPANILSGIIFIIVACYALSYIINKPFSSKNKWLDVFFLCLGAYVSGTSLIGAPLIIVAFVNHVAKEQLRNTLFMLWFILVAIKMAAFIYAGVDLQLIHQLWLLPCAGLGHWLGLLLHKKLLQAESQVFFRLVGSALLLISLIGLWRMFA